MVSTALVLCMHALPQCMRHYDARALCVLYDVSPAGVRPCTRYDASTHACPPLHAMITVMILHQYSVHTPCVHRDDCLSAVLHSTRNVD